MILTILSLFGFGAYAFADWGMGPGMMGGRGNYGPGWHHGEWNGSGYGPMTGDLNDKDLSQLYKARSEFFNATEGLRQDLYAKQLELRSELAKANPDSQRTLSLQNEISKLQARLDQKQIDYMVEMRKINPNIGRGFMGGYGMGYGPGYGPGPGGYCWR